MAARRARGARPHRAHSHSQHFIRSAGLASDLVCARVSSDDLALDLGAGTGKLTAALAATRSKYGTLVRWQTASEGQVLGFNLYRRHRHARKLNQVLIRTASGRIGRGHRFLL